MSAESLPSDESEAHQQPQPQKKSTDIKKNPANSYYYWHGHEKERAKVGDVAPMPTPQLVKRSEACEAPAIAATTSLVTKYSWCDAENAVTVYVDTKVEGQESLADGTLQVEFKKRTLSLSYVANVVSSKATPLQRKKQLLLHLSKSINVDKSEYKVKEPSGQVVLRLVKEKPSTWWELVKKNAGSGDDTEEDSEAAEVGGFSQNDAPA
ncbi:putative heat shock protein Hsp20 [Trypanosoma cruzi]|uniref:ACD-like protein n=1 Tax=Trypanosoma cruzi TaxID=5693 RepID=A0A2V2VT38_TRYCR